MLEDSEKEQILTFEKLKPENDFQNGWWLMMNERLIH